MEKDFKPVMYVAFYSAYLMLLMRFLQETTAHTDSLSGGLPSQEVRAPL
jgi:hypothetical protein